MKVDRKDKWWVGTVAKILKIVNNYDDLNLW